MVDGVATIRQKVEELIMVAYGPLTLTAIRKIIGGSVRRQSIMSALVMMEGQKVVVRVPVDNKSGRGSPQVWGWVKT